FYPSGQLTSHDSEDWDNLVDLGCTAQGDRVIMNRQVYEADVAVLVGHTQGNPYGGYSGGYKHCATGITHWRSISAHNVPQVMHLAYFVPLCTHGEMRSSFDTQGQFMEVEMGMLFFCFDAVLETCSPKFGIYSGWVKVVQAVWRLIADRGT